MTSQRNQIADATAPYFLLLPKVASKVRRHKLWWRYVSNAERTWLNLCAPQLHSDAATIGGEITERGIVVGPSERFLSHSGLSWLREASEPLLSISRTEDVQTIVSRGLSDYGKNYTVPLIGFDQEHPINSPLVKLALDWKLLEIVSSYLGLWPQLHAISAWLNFPTQSAPQQAQLWHRDREDVRTVKVFIYLTDVNAKSGPFTYVPETHRGYSLTPMGPKRQDRDITDGEMSKAFPPNSWITCTGPAQTMIIADTVGYHRGGKPLEGHRILITFTYTSGTPSRSPRSNVVGDPAWTMSDIQKYALPVRHGLTSRSTIG
jgi:hypothetical protein